MIFHKKTGCKNIWYHGITNQPVLHILKHIQKPKKFGVCKKNLGRNIKNLEIVV